MLATLRAWRLGPLSIYLNYTWLFALALITWWVALFWLPDNYPGWSAGWIWLAAITVALLFLASVIGHELAHTLVARTGRRNVNLYPFGAAVPFRLRNMGGRRILASAVVAVGFNLLLGALLLWLGNALPASGHFLSWLGAILIPLGTLNLLVALAHLIPGIPFDGGWALAGLLYFFSTDKDMGLTLARRTGWWAALALVFIGAWQGLTNDLWPQTLGFVLLGWAAAEAGMVGQQRSTLRELLTDMTAGDFMEAATEGASLDENATVADMVRTYHNLSPNKPLPVVDSEGALIGVTSVGQAEALLQGTWPSTPVRAITTPVVELQSVSASAPLVEVLAIAEARSGAREDMPDIPVLEGNRLAGSINPDKLRSFGEAGRQFGLQEALGEATERAGGGKGGTRDRLGTLGTLLPLALVLAATIVLGNVAMSANLDSPVEADASPESTIEFANFVPPDGQIVGLGQINFSAQIEAASPIISATIIVDGEVLDTRLTGSSSLTQTVTAGLPGLTLGPHTARVIAGTEDGEIGSKQWQFRVVPGAVSSPTAPTGSSEASEATTTKILVQEPSVGARIPAGESGVTIQLAIQGIGGAQPQSAVVMLDGQSLDASMESIEGAGEGEGADNGYRVSATAPSVQAGIHSAHVVIAGDGGEIYSYQWTFAALQPDADNAYFSETGYFVSQPFLAYWQQNGGLALFGLPVSDLIQETDEATGETYTAQYFERARFEMHPSLGNEVLLGRLGAMLAQPEEPAQPQPDARYFPETGHNLSGAFLQYWNDHGGLAVFGFPITEPRTEKNPIDGREYWVQYFERARFELHPEMAGTPYEVQLGLLGAQLYDRLYSKSRP